MRGGSVQFRGGSAEIGEWLESVAEFRGGSGELESGGSGRVMSKGVGSVIQPVYSHIPRQYGSLGHAQFEDEGGKAFSLILSFSCLNVHLARNIAIARVLTGRGAWLRDAVHSGNQWWEIYY